MKEELNIFIITSDALKHRFNNLNTQIGKLKLLLEKSEIFKYNFLQINNPSASDIEGNLKEYKDRVELNRDDIKDETFKSQVMPINTNQLSNFMKHLKAYELIKKTNSRYNLIIEDDLIIIDEYVINFEELLKRLPNFNYDLIFTSIAINDNSQEFDFRKTTDGLKIIMAKSSYFISTETAINLLEYFKKIKFTFKINLSYYIWENKETIKSYVCNKNVFFEGSKIGLFVTSVNNNNFLFQNGEYVRLNQLINNNDELSDELISEMENIYNNSGKNNPDFQHSLGLAYYKFGDYKKAKEIMIEAMHNYKKMNGFICQHNELLNNCINMHQFEQSDIENVLKLQGIYS
jgi:GR25 family glycosyltransferase involved in LPS biosynthesis